MAKSKQLQSKISEKSSPRQRLSQSVVPNSDLMEALKIADAIQNNYGGKPVTPLQLAQALNVSPASSSFRNLCGASIAYGMTEGGYNASQISITTLAKRIVRPTQENDDLSAKREAFLIPTVIKKFLEKYDGSPLPRIDIGKNILAEMGVPESRTEAVLKLIVETASSLGFIKEIKEKKYVELLGQKANEEDEVEPGTSPGDNEIESVLQAEVQKIEFEPSQPENKDQANLRRVFITHGKNKSFVDPLKRLLEYGELEAVVAAETHTASQPVPDKVMNEMRTCRAAIIHVEDETKLKDENNNEQAVLNANVLIEIGAAMALYGRRFILLVKKGVTLPSNLQGLFEVRYEGEMLNAVETINLMEAIKHMKQQ